MNGKSVLQLVAIIIALVVTWTSTVAYSAFTCWPGGSDTLFLDKECSADTNCAERNCIPAGPVTCSADGQTYNYAKFDPITVFGEGCGAVEQGNSCTKCTWVQCAQGYMYEYVEGQCLVKKCPVTRLRADACTFDS